ncbi:MAG: hypothetical protein JST66_00930 [Bacteroidetes bacterium]|nr:hypothetical protein [Bacteroidota bacterium]
MGAKRFRTRQHWYRTRAWVLAGASVSLLCLLLLGTVVPYLLFIVVLGISFTGTLVAMSIDRANTILYLLDRERMTLVRADRREELGLDQLIDANLLDSTIARDYVRQRSRAMQEKGATADDLRRMKKVFLRYCAMDVGLGTLSALVRPLERLPNGKKDLVLLRIRDGREMLLSPIHHQDMVDAIAKLLHRPASAPPEQQRA